MVVVQNFEVMLGTTLCHFVRHFVILCSVGTAVFILYGNVIILMPQFCFFFFFTKHVLNISDSSTSAKKYSGLYIN
jgi:hypothetical protein